MGSLPTVLHQIWLGGNLPFTFQRFAETWKEHHPKWNYILWTSADLPELRNYELIRNAASYVPEANIPQFLADVLRYEILAEFGGVYVDTDMECRKPLDGLIAGAVCFAAWEVQDRFVGNAILGAVPHHPFIERLVEQLPASVEKHKGQVPARSSGPHFVTEQYRTDPRGVTVFDQRLMYPAAWNELSKLKEDFPDAWAVHWWSNQHRKKGIPL